MMFGVFFIGAALALLTAAALLTLICAAALSTVRFINKLIEDLKDDEEDIKNEEDI